MTDEQLDKARRFKEELSFLKMHKQDITSQAAIIPNRTFRIEVIAGLIDFDAYKKRVDEMIEGIEKEYAAL